MDKPSASSSRFRFRDHSEMENSTQSDTSSNISSAFSDPDDDSELQSMAAKGIKHLCSELLELKGEFDEDFHRNIFSSCATFVSIFEEVGNMENQIIQLKNQVIHQKLLLEDLLNGRHLKALSKEATESIFEELVIDEPLEPSEVEAHIRDISETLDIHLLEKRFDEAITILEMEEENFLRLQLDDNHTEDMLLLYNSTIVEKKATLTLELLLVAENPRIATPELQKTLAGLCRLGEGHLVTQLLIKYYHSHIATRILTSQHSKSLLDVIYIRELAKFVFSMISQAARSFVVLHGKTSPYFLELIQWACEETQVLACYVSKYAKSISEMSGGLYAAVQALQFAMTFCSLLENQKLVLLPCLINKMQPCMEEVLQIQVDHFKKVIHTFTSADSWVLSKYLVSGILNEGISSTDGQKIEYCTMTSSGWKFITVLQDVIADVIPLISLQMESSILKAAVDLFSEYMLILEIAITAETDVMEEGGPMINLAKSLPQQVSILANISALELLFSGVIKDIFRGMNQSVDFQEKKLSRFLLPVQEAKHKLRFRFCQLIIHRIMSLNSGKRTADACTKMPSVAFQVLFSELRTLNKLAEDNVFELDWLKVLLRELMESIFVWMAENEHIWIPTKESMTQNISDPCNQFVLDIHFLVEIASYGGYFSDNTSVLETLMNSTITLSGHCPKREVDYTWAQTAAIEAIEKLTETEKPKSPITDVPVSVFEEEEEENQVKYASDSSQDNNVVTSPSKDWTVDRVATDVAETVTSDTESRISEGFVDLVEVEVEVGAGFSAARSDMNAEESIGKSEDIEYGKARE